jgi:hypothetical protein
MPVSVSEGETVLHTRGLDDPVAFFIEHHNARQSEAVDALLRVSPGSKINGPVLDRWPIRKTWLAASWRLGPPAFIEGTEIAVPRGCMTESARPPGGAES